MEAKSTASAEEIDRFEALAETWWDTNGAFRPLHRFNPARLGVMRERLLGHFRRDGGQSQPFQGLSLLDIGCGGGLVSEPMARLGFEVTGIDAGEKNVAVARRHASQNGLDIDYRSAAPEEVGGLFDVVLAMEVVEHVSDIPTFMKVAADRLKPDGIMIVATLNRTPKSFLLAKFGAEYVLRWLPRGTHDWRKFLRPSELAVHLRRAGLTASAFDGLRYDLLRDRWEATTSLDVNYMITAVKG